MSIRRTKKLLIAVGDVLLEEFKKECKEKQITVSAALRLMMQKCVEGKLEIELNIREKTKKKETVTT